MATPIQLVNSWFRNVFQVNRSATAYQNPGLTGKFRNNNYYDAFLQYLGHWGQTNYDPKRPEYISEGYMQNGDVYAVVNQIATKASSVPFSVRKITDPMSERVLIQKRSSLIRGDERSHMELKLLGAQAYSPDPQPLPFAVPNPHQTWPEFIALHETFYNVVGESFLYWTTPTMGVNKGKPIQLFCLPAHLIQIVVKDGWMELPLGESPVAYYQLIYQDRYYKFPAEQVMHITMSNPEFDYQGRHLYGLSPLRAVWYEIMAGNEGNKNNIRMQKSGGGIGLIYGKKDILEEEQAKELKQRLVEMRNDPTALSQIAGISMEIGFERIALSTKDMMPYDNQTYVQKKICNALGWSDKLLNNDEGAKYDNMVQAYKTVITNKLEPDLNALGEALTRFFLPKFGTAYKNCKWIFHYEQLPEMQTDIKSMTEWILPLIREGVITRKEARNIMNFEVDNNPLLDMYTTNVNTLPLADAVNPNLDSIVGNED